MMKNLCLGSLVLSMLFSPLSYAEYTLELDDVIVTAQRRDERLQTVPITVNSFDHDFLTTIGAQSLSDLDNVSPGLEVIAISATHPKFKIRGIGTLDFGIGTDPSVSIYHDDVYVGRSGGALLQFTDIERVEVLKGPQGTLFGRNSAAGVIHIISNKPSNEQLGSLRMRIGNYDKRLVEAMFNTAVVDDRLFLRMNAIYNDRDGFIDNIDGGDDFSDEGYKAARARLLWLASDSTELDYTFEVNSVDQQAPPAIGLNSILSPSANSLSGKVANDVINGHDERTLRAHTFKLQHDFSSATMTWITSYREFNSTLREDEEGTNNQYTYFDSENSEDNRQFSQELRFNGSSERVDWVAGVYYSNEHAKQTLNATVFTDSLNAIAQGSLPNSPLPNVPLPSGLLWSESVQNKLKSQSISAFADVTWAATEELDLTVGIRYTRDKKQFSWKNNSNDVLGLGFDQLFPSPIYPLAYKNTWVDRGESWSNTSPRIVASYQFNDDLMSFVSYSQGYKAGGFNALQTLSSFDPETVDSLEWGVKSSWLANTLLFNAALFYYEYNDKQDVNFEQNGGVGTFITRTGNAVGRGGEFELHWLATDNLQLGLNYSYLDAEWTKRIVNAADYNTGISQNVNLSGYALKTPKHHIVMTADYAYSLQSHGDLLFHIDHNTISKQQFNPADADYYFDYEYRDSAQHYTNMRMAWQPKKEQWSVALWAENIFDNRYAYNVVPVSASTLTSPYVNPRKPRLWGIEMMVNF